MKKINEKRLLDKLSKVGFLELSKYLGMYRSGLYYHYYNLKKGKLTFKEEVIKKISLYLSDREDIFFD